MHLEASYSCVCLIMLGLDHVQYACFYNLPSTHKKKLFENVITLLNRLDLIHVEIFYCTFIIYFLFRDQFGLKFIIQ